MRTLKYLGAAAAVLLLAALALGWLLLRASLPRLDGALAASGLTGAVRITRDSRGVPTIEATDRADLAYASGFVHAQDRYFQMDLSRRLAAGELAELFGGVALEQDRRARLFRVRTVAREVLAQAAPADPALLEAYARGVNAGDADLAGRPWEDWVLGAPPLPWRPEDTILIEHAMWWDLQANGLRREILRQEINARLGGAQCGARWKCGLGFLYPAGTSWDAPAVPASEGLMPAAQPPVPSAEVLDVRNAGAAAPASGSVARAPAAGSNSWAVAGRLTATRAALIANGMHLGLRGPPLWYHARLRTVAGAAAEALDLNGVTLPGAPLLVAGSNGHIAWGFTNSYGTWLDVTRVPCTAAGQHELTTPSGAAALSGVREEIRVHGEAPIVLEVKSAPAGVLLRADEAQHSCWFGAWLAQNPAATNLGLMALDRATPAAAAPAPPPPVGIPHQNGVTGAQRGQIGWPLYGRIPEDTGPSRARGGAPWTTLADHPRIVDPPLGRIWTANARLASDDHQLRLIGGGVAAPRGRKELRGRGGPSRDELLGPPGNNPPPGKLPYQLHGPAPFL